MLRRVVWLGLVCSCTEDFGPFTPADDAAVVDVASDGPSPAESGVDAAQADVKAEASPKDVTVQDVAVDVVPDVAPDAPVTCTETGAVVYNNHCYFFVSSAQNQTTAKTACQQANNAHLVTITSAGEQSAVNALGTGERWIGLFRSGGAAKDQFYNWITGEGRNNYSNWSPNEPNGTGQCATMLGTNLWNDQDCTISLPSICERE